MKSTELYEIMKQAEELKNDSIEQACKRALEAKEIERKDAALNNILQYIGRYEYGENIWINKIN